MATVKWYSKNEYFDKDMKQIAAEDLSKHPIYIERTAKYTYAGNKAGKDTNISYILHKNGKKVQINNTYFTALQSSKADFEKAFDAISQKNANSADVKIKNSKWYLFRTVAIVIAIVAAIAVPVSYGVMTSDKNFTGKTIEVNDSNWNEVKEGDFVKTDVFILDAYSIEITETTTKYGIELNSTTSEGNTYLLGAFNDAESMKTFIYRFGPNSQSANDFKALQEDEYLLSSLTGEIKNLSAIEKLDSGEQVVPYFQTTLTDYYAETPFEQPTLMIDGRVTPGDMNQVIMVSGLAAAIAIASVVLIVVSHKKHKEEIKKFVRMAGGAGESPIIK